MKTKILGIVSAVSAVVLGLGASLANAQMTTTTLASSVDTVNGTTMDYFTVLLAHYWPFVVGFLILLAVWHFGKRIISAFS